MNWKSELRLSDLDPAEEMEVTCRRCGLTRYERASVLLARDDLRQAFIDEAERALRCNSRICRGPVRCSLVHDGKTEGFVGGLP